MGHLQDMSDKQRSEFISMKIELDKEARRGHSYQYPNNEQQLKLDELGYKTHIFKGSYDTMSESLAKERVDNYRKHGYYSRIVCYPNEIIGAKFFTVIYRKKP